MNPRNLLFGALAGLTGGIVFGAMMAFMGTLPMIGKMVGSPSPVTGFLVHLVNSVIIGAAFAVVFDRTSRSTVSGLLSGLGYGGIWWILGPLTLMPLFLGMGLGVNWNAAAATKMLPSLIGHLIYGTILGVAYVRFQGRSSDEAVIGARVSPAHGR